MSTVCHSFGPSLERGQRFEEMLDKHFSREFQIQKVDMTLQRMGIDRIFTRYSDGARFTVEYKSDERTEGTGNVFIETVSVDKDNKPGWALTSMAQLVVYFIPQWGRAFIANTLSIRKRVPEWRETYKERPANNDGYKTIGIPVPIGVFRVVCKVVEVSNGSA